MSKTAPSRRLVLGSLAGTGLAGLLGPSRATAAGAERRHGIAMHGAPTLAPGFAHLPYVNPEAPKGGRLTLANIGGFDSLNPFVVRGQAVGAVRTYVFESLLTRSHAEPFSLYGLIAESIEMPEDRGSITFHLNPAARFSDGHAIDAADVEFTWQLLRTKGWPNLRAYYNKVERVERVGERSIRFLFPNANDRELPLILGLMPVLPAHAIDEATFDQTSLERPLGSGPYRVGPIDPGNVITFERDRDWWGRDLPVNRGLHNFDEVRIEFYRDVNTLFEAFKKGLIDVRFEDDPNRWATQYDFPAVRERRVVLDTSPIGLPRPMLGFVFNTRRALFADRRVRAAMLEFFDFEWINANLFNGGFRRTASFFQGSELSSVGNVASPAERALLAAFPNAVTAEAMEGRQTPPVSDGSGFDRARIRRGMDLLRAAGWQPRDGRLVDARGTQMTIEIMILHAGDERVALAWKRVLDRVGIDLSIRRVDSAQWERRRQAYDYDMVPWSWGGTLSPGNEQAFRWGSRVADQPGSLNLAGVKEPAVDAVVERLVGALTREELVTAARALDRLLISGVYVLPLFHLPEQRFARWVGVERPRSVALPGQLFETWWRRPS